MNETDRVAIVGGGTMGSCVATLFCGGGWHVDVVSRSAATRAALPAKVAAGLKRMGADPSCAERLRVYEHIEQIPWSEVTLVNENVVEDLELKRQIFRQVRDLAPAQALLSSNSSSLPISEIGAGLDCRSRMYGLHFYLPAYLVPLVEVVSSADSDPEGADRLMQWMWALGKRPVHVKRDIVGFLGNRMQHALIREAVHLVASGVATAEDVDAAVRYGFGFRLAIAGPLLQREHAGWEMSTAVARSIYPHLASPSQPSEFIESMIREGRYGMKTGRGMYEWTPESIAAEKERYERALQATLKIFAAEGLSLPEAQN
jgi:3-hydroxybutyryl-CoA dehydrogenase